MVALIDGYADNWVLTTQSGESTGAADRLAVRLIDFGKAQTAAAASSPQELTRLWETRSDERLLEALYWADSSAAPHSAVTYVSAGKSLPPAHRADYFGLCGCVHQLLHLEDLAVQKLTAQEAERRGYSVCCLRGGQESVAPRSSLKRYVRLVA